MNNQRKTKLPVKRPDGWLLFYLLLLGGIIIYAIIALSKPMPSFTVSELMRFIRGGYVSKIKVIVNKNRAEFFFKQPVEIDGIKIMSGEVIYGSLENFEKEVKEAIKEAAGSTGVAPSLWFDIEKEWIWEFLWIGGLTFLIFLFIMGLRRGQGFSIFNIGKAQALVYEKGMGEEVTFKDVAGLKEAKEELMEVVSFLKNPEKYIRLGARIPKGILLIGPPGTGKTLLAKAVASEANVPFFSISGSEFVEMFVGVGASRVRDLFQQAKQKAPCIIFIDEIDAIGRMRGKFASITGNEERENTLNQLLTEMDGFKPNMGIIVLAATNRPDILDKALTRPGRFDRAIYLSLPDIEERKEIFEVHLKKIKASVTPRDIEILAKQTPGLAGADIANICNEAALIAARKNKEEVTIEDLSEAVEKVVMGLEKKSRALSEEEKRRVAIHESGHVVAAWFLDRTPQVLKVTIIPRGQALGAAWYLPEEKYLQSRTDIEKTIQIALAGRAAEEIILGDVSTGAADDLSRVTKMAYGMVAIAGMDPEMGSISLHGLMTETELILGKPYSEETARLIDMRVRSIIEENYRKVTELLRQKKHILLHLASALLQKETLTGEEIEEIIKTYEKPPALPSPTIT